MNLMIPRRSVSESNISRSWSQWGQQSTRESASFTGSYDVILCSKPCAGQRQKKSLHQKRPNSYRCRGHHNVMRLRVLISRQAFSVWGLASLEEARWRFSTTMRGLCSLRPGLRERSWEAQVSRCRENPLLGS